MPRPNFPTSLPALKENYADNADDCMADDQNDQAKEINAIAGFIGANGDALRRIFGYYDFNVKDYGATGDGTTDDITAITAAVAAAVDSVNDGGGGTVFFPEGIYKITTTLTTAKGIRLVGANSRSAIIYYTGVGTAVATGGHVGEIDHLHITSLDPTTVNHLIGNNVGTGSGDIGIKISHTDWNIHHCTISYFNDATLKACAIKTDGSYCFSGSYKDNFIRYCWGGISLEDTITDIVVADNTIFDVEKYGISIGYDWDAAARTAFVGDNFRVHGNVIENVCRAFNDGGGVGNGYGIYLGSGSTTGLRGNYIEDVYAETGNTAYGIYGNGVADGNLLNISIFENNTATSFTGAKYNVWIDYAWYGGGGMNHFEGITGGVYLGANVRWMTFLSNFFTGAPSTPYSFNGQKCWAFDGPNNKFYSTGDAITFSGLKGTNTKSIFISASAFAAVQGTPDQADPDDCGKAWRFDAAAEERVGAAISLPGWVGGEVNAYIYWTSQAETSGNVIFAIRKTTWLNENNGSDAGSAQATVTDSPNTPARNMNVTGALSLGTPAAASDMMLIGVGRLGDNGSDTMAGDAYFWGIRIDYTGW